MFQTKIKQNNNKNYFSFFIFHTDLKLKIKNYISQNLHK
jgi:hypothetical protein